MSYMYSICATITEQFINKSSNNDIAAKQLQQQPLDEYIWTCLITCIYHFPDLQSQVSMYIPQIRRGLFQAFRAYVDPTGALLQSFGVTLALHTIAFLAINSSKEAPLSIGAIFGLQTIKEIRSFSWPLTVH